MRDIVFYYGVRSIYIPTYGPWDTNTARGRHASFFNYTLTSEAGGACNPARSLAVKEWLKGYTRMMGSLGYSSQSAHPWTTEDLRTVLTHLDTLMSSASGATLLKLRRDPFAMTILWDSCSRGCAALTWQLRDILKPEGEIC